MELPEVTAHDLLVALILAVPPELASRVGRLAALTDTAVPLLFPWGDAREANRFFFFKALPCPKS